MTVAPALDALMLARWQFGITTVYHFIFVPLTIGLSLFVAVMQTAWHRTGKDYWLKATRFFGKLFLINFAIGVATGIVQEFQFGMNWSEYSRFSGDIFGGPLAVEALLSFFLESTFLGLWIFGWGKISARAHLACIWLVALGVNTSAMWILGANSWMQHPVGAVFDAERGRATLNGVGGFLEVVTNPIMWVTIFHVVASSWLVAGTLIAGLGIWWMTRSAKRGGAQGEIEARETWRPIARFGMAITLVGGLLTGMSGHIQAQEIVVHQPAKMAAAEGLCQTTTNAPFTLALFSIDCKNQPEGNGVGEVPGLLSFLAGNSTDYEVQGLNDIDAQYAEKYGVETMAPPILPTFWTFRAMIFIGMVSVLLAIWGLWATRGNKVTTSSFMGKVALWMIPLPFLGTSFGWIFTEIGRQPFLIHPRLLAGNDPIAQVWLRTSDGLSGAVGAGMVLTSTIVFTLLYAALGVVWFVLLKRYAKEGVHHEHPVGESKSDPDTFNFAY